MANRDLKEVGSIDSSNPFVEKIWEDSPFYPVEREIAFFIKEVLEELGFSPKLVGMTEQRPNIVCELSKGKPKIILCNHMDTVKPSKGWESDPWTPIIKDGKLYGLGAADMKAGLSSYLWLAKQISGERIKTEIGIELHFTVGEETGGPPFGAKYVLEKGYKGNFCIIRL